MLYSLGPVAVMVINSLHMQQKNMYKTCFNSITENKKYAILILDRGNTKQTTISYILSNYKN